jgi:hypothetical protein
MILPDVAPVGIVAVIFESFTTVMVIGTLLRQNLTSKFAPVNPLPLISILVPVAAEYAESDVIFGGVVTLTDTEVEPLIAIVDPEPAGGAGWLIT